MAALAGKWKQTRTENMEDYLKEINLNIVKRKLVLASSPTMDITVDGSNYTIKTSTTFSTQLMEFTVGTEFETTMPGVTEGKFKCTPTLEGDKLVIVAEPIDANVKGTTTTREIVGDELLTTMKCGDVVCKRYFKK